MWYGAAIRLAQDGSAGLDLQGVLDNIPIDPASVFVYLLLLGTIVLIIRGSRGGRGKGRPAR